MLVKAATDLFNAMLQQQVAEVAFSSSGSEDNGDTGSPGGDVGSVGGEDSEGGIGGDAGDGGELSPFVNASCEFVLDPKGDTALTDLLQDGSLDRLDLQGLAANLKGDVSIQKAFARFFPQGMHLLGSNGQPLRTTTDAQGTYFLRVPVATGGFVRCAAGPQLAVSAFVRARQPGERLTHDVSPSSQIFTTFILPQLTVQDSQAVESNFLTDIGALKTPSGGIVRVETVATPEGKMIADTDGDGMVCSLLIDSPQAGGIQYVGAGAMSYTAIALFKALLIEARNPPSTSYETILANVLTRQDATGNPRVEILEEDLRAGGVPVGRATELAVHLNTCIRFGVERVLGTQLPRSVQAGRFRVTVLDATGAPASLVRVGGVGSITAASECQDAQGARVTPLDRVDTRIVCSADANGQITFILVGIKPLVSTSVAWSVRSPDDTRLLGKVDAPFVPTATLDAVVTIPSQ
jgi:hypothetical protein